MSTREPIEKKQSAADGPEWPAFFVPPVGFIQHVNPYAVLGIHEETLQPDIASALEKVDGVNDPSRVEYAAAAVVSDPVRRLLWHCLRWPTEPPSAWAFVRRYRATSVEGNIAAYLLHEAVTRELQGLRGDALVELWAQVKQEFEAFLANPRLGARLAMIAARWRINSPTLPGEVKCALQDVVAAMHALLMVSSEEPGGQWFHWSNITKPKGNTRLLDACALHMSMRALEKARREFEHGNIIVGLELYAMVAAAIPQSEPREKRRLLFDVCEHLMRPSTRLSVFSTGDLVERAILLLRSIGKHTAFDSRLLLLIAFFHARAAELAADLGDINAAANHLLNAGLCDDDGPLEMEMGEDNVLRIMAPGTTWSIGFPLSTQLMTTLEHWISALEAEQPRQPGIFGRELWQHAEGIDLVTRLDIPLPNDVAIALATLFLTQVSIRDRTEPFSLTRAEILSTQPEFADTPWEAIEALDRQGNGFLSHDFPTNALPRPPLPFNLHPSILAYITHLRHSQKTLEMHAGIAKSNARAKRATFVSPWFFSNLRGSAREVVSALFLAFWMPLRFAIAMVLAPVVAFLAFSTDNGRAVTGLFYLIGDQITKCVEMMNQFFRVWFAYESHTKTENRALYGLAKFQALAAMVLMAAGLFYLADKFGREYLMLHQRDKAYAALCNAASTKDMTEVARAARGFLNATPPEKFDYRTLDVLEKHSEALVREMARAARDKRQADLDQLVAEATTIQKRTQTEKQAWKEIEEAR